MTKPNTHRSDGIVAGPHGRNPRSSHPTGGLQTAYVPAGHAALTLYVDTGQKGSGLRPLDTGDYRQGCWTALVAHGARVERFGFREASTREQAEEALRRELGLSGRRKLEWAERGETLPVAWRAVTKATWL